MISKSLSEIRLQDFQQLIDNSIPEGRTIEYKQTLNLKPDSEKKEFLADVSSFANSAGGDLIYGIAENKDSGLPEKIIGVTIDNIDEFKLQIDSLIRDGLTPRINGVQIETFETVDSKQLLLIRIPKSWNSPHQVILKGTDKFFARASNGKYQMDINELKAAFLLTDTIAAKIRGFIAERISTIELGDSPIPLLPNAKIALHLVPISSFSLTKTSDFLSAKLIKDIRPLNGGSRTPRYNLDGLISSSMTRTTLGHDSYVQLFRNGIIETVNAEFLEPNGTNLWIPASSSKNNNYEYHILDTLKEYIELYKSLDVDLPVFLFLSLINIKGYTIASEFVRHPFNEPTLMPKNILILPEVIIQNLDENLPALLRPQFDTIWNACGFERSYSYDESGQFKFKV